MWPENFDIVVANPPYGNKENMGLYAKYNKKCLNLYRKWFISVHPATHYLNQNPKNFYNRIINKSEFDKDLVDLVIFNANTIFGTEFFYPCAISTFSNNKTGGISVYNGIYDSYKEINSIEDLHLLDISPVFNPLYTKIKEIPGNKLSDTVKQPKRLKEKDSKWGWYNGEDRKDKNSINIGKIQASGIVYINRIKGNVEFGNKESSMFSGGAANRKAINYSIKMPMWKKDFWILANKSYVNVNENPSKAGPHLFWNFETEKEAQNFLDYLKTDFARFCLALMKITQCRDLWTISLIPWLDFTEKWDDQKLYTHFDITEEEQEFIRSVIPPYYN
jgi:hypothetical protein